MNIFQGQLLLDDKSMAELYGFKIVSPAPISVEEFEALVKPESVESDAEDDTKR